MTGIEIIMEIETSNRSPLVNKMINKCACGFSAILIENPEENLYAVECSSSLCDCSTVDYDSPEKAIKVWNNTYGQ